MDSYRLHCMPVTVQSTPIFLRESSWLISTIYERGNGRTRLMSLRITAAISSEPRRSACYQFFTIDISRQPETILEQPRSKLRSAAESLSDR